MMNSPFSLPLALQTAQSWVMKAKYALEAVIYEHDPSHEDGYDKIRAVPQDKVVATLEGTWKGQITWKKKGEKVSCWREREREKANPFDLG
jgi:predicted secreted protein